MSEEDIIPASVPCPCGNGYAERYPEVRTEIVRRGMYEVRQETYVYKHEGCPIGGHIVTHNGYVQNKQGPLFTAGPSKVRQIIGERSPGQAVATDGGESL